MGNKTSILYTNGNIYTVEGSEWNLAPCQSMVVDEQGIIVNVGTKDECMPFKNSETKIIDLNGRTVLPGMIDAHVHAPGESFTELYEINLKGIDDYKEAMAIIRKFVNDHPDKKAYFGTGIKTNMVNEEGEHLCAKWLDEICDKKPITIHTLDMHSIWLNTKAMELCGINAQTEASDGGVIHRDENGVPNGLFTDVRNMNFLDPVYTNQEKISALKKFVTKLNGWGYTSIASVPPYTFMECTSYLDIEKEGLLTLNVNCGQTITPANYEDDLNKLDMLNTVFDKSGIKVNIAKFFVDGVVEGKTAYLKEPYMIEAGMGDSYCGSAQWSRKALNRAVYQVIKRGYQCHMHTIGDAAVEMALDAIEFAQNNLNSKSTRNVLTHLQLIKEKDKDRFSRQKVIAAIQPVWHYKDPIMYYEIERPYLGETRASNEYPARSLAERGVLLTSSADYPITLSDNPFQGIQVGATRDICHEDILNDTSAIRSNGTQYILNREERLTVPQLIESYTINGAFQLFRENETGSLVAGKSADFIVIDQDIINDDILNICNTQIEATIYKGEVVYGSL